MLILPSFLQRDQTGGDTEPNKDLIGGVSSQDEDHPSGSQTRTSGFSAFAAAGLMDEIPDGDDADGGGGGLMVSMFCSSQVFLQIQSCFQHNGQQSLIKSSAKSKKDRKQKGKADNSNMLEEQDRVDTGSKTPVEATADDLADETWNKKGKKGKVGEESEVKGMHPLIRVPLYCPLTPVEGATPVECPDPKPQEEDNLEEGEEPGVKVLSKKEKEKLKKEREKVSSFLFVTFFSVEKKTHKSVLLLLWVLRI
jgi:translation initiation factor 5B